LERRIDLLAKSEHCTDDDGSDERYKQTVLDSGCALFILEKTNHLFHFQSSLIKIVFKGLMKLLPFTSLCLFPLSQPRAVPPFSVWLILIPPCPPAIRLKAKLHLLTENILFPAFFSFRRTPGYQL
jgi:hypothetical protein